MSTHEPDEDRILGYHQDGTPFSRRSMREAHEQARMASQEFRLSMRRMLLAELKLDQLQTLQQLFTMLGQMKNPLVVLSWWEGQIDLAVHMRESMAGIDLDAAAVEPDPIETAEVGADEPDTEIAAPDPAFEPDAPGYTLDAHPFKLPTGDAEGCQFATNVPGLSVPYVCGLPREAKQHT